MVYICQLKWVRRVTNIDIWRPRDYNYSETKALELSITHFSN